MPFDPDVDTSPHTGLSAWSGVDAGDPHVTELEAFIELMSVTIEDELGFDSAFGGSPVHGSGGMSGVVTNVNNAVGDTAKFRGGNKPLSDRVPTVESDLNTAESDIDTLEKDLNALETLVTGSSSGGGGGGGGKSLKDRIVDAEEAIGISSSSYASSKSPLSTRMSDMENNFDSYAVSAINDQIQSTPFLHNGSSNISALAKWANDLDVVGEVSAEIASASDSSDSSVAELANHVGTITDDVDSHLSAGSDIDYNNGTISVPNNTFIRRGNAGAEVPTYSSKSAARSAGSLSKGELVFIDGEGLFVEDGS